jgi:hypothetical protein
MSERDQPKPPGGPGRVLRCDEWENLIADALDGSLGAADAAAFTRHQNECALCARMLKETQQGKAWLTYLVVEPEAPAGLLARILAQTSEPQHPSTGPGVALPVRAVTVRPAWHGFRLTPQLRQVFDPRLMMTAAMAFFSIALTLNLTGIKLTGLRAADLQPGRLRVTLTRQYYSTNEQVMKYYENLRVVYEMEARVRELRRSTEAETPQQPSRPSQNDNPKQPVRDGTGTPSSTAPTGGQTFPVSPGRRTPLAGDAAQPMIMAEAQPERPRPAQTETNGQAERSLV